MWSGWPWVQTIRSSSSSDRPNPWCSRSSSLRDPTNNQVRFDARTANLVIDGDWGTTRPGEFSVYANIPSSHNQWSDLSLFEDEYILEVRVKDREDRVAEASYTVRPQCTELSQARPPGPDVLAECLCICRAGYMIGDTCQGEGGAGGGT